MDDKLILVVLVIYNVRLEESPAFISLSKCLANTDQTISIFVYDNSPATQTYSAGENWEIEYQSDTANPGVAKAYNEGFKKAKEQKKKWILICDQDTIFPSDFFNKFNEALVKNPSVNLFASIIRNESVIISPFKFYLGKGRVLDDIHSKSFSLNEVKVINSGLVISTDLFEQCHGFDERFPLDFSDLVFIQRVKGFCSEIFVIDAICSHGLSSEENSYSAMISRFPHFLRASRLYGKLFGDSFFLFLNRFFRSVKLTYKFQSSEFIKSFVRIELERIPA